MRAVSRALISFVRRALLVNRDHFYAVQLAAKEIAKLHNDQNDENRRESFERFARTNIVREGECSRLFWA